MIHYRSIVGVEERPMNLTRTWISMAVVVCGGLLGTPPAWNQTGVPSQKKDRARVVMSQALPALDGDRLKAVLVEVRYGPGEASTRHSHPCAVIGYVAEGYERNCRANRRGFTTPARPSTRRLTVCISSQPTPAPRNRRSCWRTSSAIAIHPSLWMCRNIAARQEHPDEPASPDRLG